MKTIGKPLGNRWENHWEAIEQWETIGNHRDAWFGWREHDVNIAWEHGKVENSISLGKPLERHGEIWGNHCKMIGKSSVK